MNEISELRRTLRIVIVSLLVASGGLALYLFLTRADVVLVAIALFVALALITGFVLERIDRSRKPSSGKPRPTDYWRLPPR